MVTASQLAITAIQGDGHPVTVEMCIRSRDAANRRCERTAEDGTVLFKDLLEGVYVVSLQYHPVWKAETREIVVSGGDRQELQLRVTPRIDFESLDQLYADFWHVRLEWLSGWGAGGTIEVIRYTTGTAVARWRPPLSTDEPQKMELEDEERDRLLEALKRARLFGGGYVGTDTTATDGPFNTLYVKNGGAAAVLVTSGNPSFETGARRELLRLLSEYRDRLIHK